MTRHPRPRTPELEKLANWVGRWVFQGHVKASSSHPAYEWNSTEDVEWLPGGSFLLMQWAYRAPNYDGLGITVMGYDVNEKAYFSYTFDELGRVVRFKGRLEGDTLILDRADTFERDGKVMMSRRVYQRVSPTRQVFRGEISHDNASWRTIEEGTATKVPLAAHPSRDRPGLTATATAAAAPRTASRAKAGSKKSRRAGRGTL